MLPSSDDNTRRVVNVNLFQLAAENEAGIVIRFQEAKDCSQDGGQLLDDFAACVEGDARVSMNMRPCVLSGLVSGRKHQNMYERAGEQGSLCKRSVEEILAENLGRFFSRRISFDDTFEEGRCFRYGALNIGGVGADRYGIFCAVLSSDFVGPDTSIAYLTDDSLTTYMPNETVVDITKLRQEVGTHSHRHYLVAVKHAGELDTSNRSDWPTMVCCNDRYCEAIFVEDVDLSSVDAVRVKEAEYTRLFALAFNEYTQHHDDATHSLKADFVRILQAEQEGHFHVEKV